MKLDSPLWQKKWRKRRFDRTVSHRLGIRRLGCGSNREPWSSLWCACFSEAMGSWYGENMRVVDYGCGKGRYFNFLTGQLQDFAYCGLEVGETKHGRNCIKYARGLFGEDSRARFGFLGTEFEREALLASDVVILASVFTHLDFDDSVKILDKLLALPSVRIIVFSVFWDVVERFGKSGTYGDEKCYGFAYHEEDRWRRYFEEKKLNVVLAEEYGKLSFVHKILRVEVR